MKWPAFDLRVFIQVFYPQWIDSGTVVAAVGRPDRSTNNASNYGRLSINGYFRGNFYR